MSSAFAGAAAVHLPDNPAANALAATLTRWILVACLLILPPLALVLDQAVPGGAALLVFAASQAALVGLALAYTALTWRSSSIARVQLYWLAFLTWLAVATIIALFRFRELGSVPMLNPYVSFVLWTSPLFVLPALLRTRADLDAVQTGLDVLGLLVVASVLLPYLGLEFGEVQVAEGQGLRRVFGPIGDSVALLLAFFAVDAYARRRYARLAAFLVALMATVGLAGILVSITALGFVTLMAIRRGELRVSRSTLWKLLAIAPAFAVLLVVTAAGIVTRLQSESLLAFTLASRIGSYQSAWAVFTDNWLTGVGYTGLKAVVYRYEPQGIFELFSENVASTAQNQLLQTATDAGVIGVLLVVVFAASGCAVMFRAAYRGVATNPRYVGAAAWGLALCVANQSGVWLMPNSLVPFLFCVLAGMAIVQVRLDRQDRAVSIAARDAETPGPAATPAS